MANFRPKLNEKSQGKFGDKSLRVDKEEIVVTRLNGASTREQKYHRHKDSYFHDPNNELDGMALRKLSLVVFLNEDLDLVEHKGILRMFTQGRETVDGVVDVSPRLGRAVMFKSEEMLHQVLSSHGQNDYTLTIYFTQIVDKPMKQHPIPDGWKIFVSIASYRDIELIKTLRSLVSGATYPDRLRIVIYNQ